MFAIPHSVMAVVLDDAAPLAALLVVGVLALLGRAGAWRPALAALVGWAVMTPWAAWPAAVWAPHRAASVLLAPGAVVAAALGAGMATARPRLVGFGLAAFAGWWVARQIAGSAEFWRVWAAVGVLPLLLRRTTGGAPAPVLATLAALAGGLAVAQAPAAVVMASLAPALVAAAELAVGGVAMPPALIAAVIGVAALDGGRLLRGRVGAVDLACVAALAAPLLAGWVQRRLGRVGSRAGAGLCGLAGAGLSIALLWFARRAFLT